jgi:Na+/H+ antiporter NhaD/arsenite permease-like protein
MEDNLKRYAVLVLIVGGVAVLTAISSLDVRQSVSVLIISLFISSTFLFWKRRLSFAFLGVSFLLLLNVLDIKHLLEFANFEIIIFLIGMMIIVGYLERNHFFEYIIGKLIRRVGKSGKMLVVVLLVLAAISAALVDEVTSILIMMSVVLHVTQKYKVNPLPFVLMTVFATNIGSSATVVGNPVGVMVAFNAGLTFSDFLRWATPISAIALLAAILIMFLFFRKNIAELDQNVKDSYQKQEHELISKQKMVAPLLLFSGVLAGLVMHKQVEHLLGLEKNTLLIGFALIGAGVAMLLSRDRAPELVERRVDWWTLMFFMFLFASVGSLKFTGVVDMLAGSISGFTGGNLIKTILVIMIVGGVMSAVLDNVLAVAIMIPVIQSLIESSAVPANPLWWSILFTATFWGNLTFIGSTANVVALGVLQKRRLGHIGFREWIIPGAIVTFITMLIAFLLIVIQIPLMGGA